MINPRDVSLKQAGRNAIAILMLAVFVLAGCQGQSLLDVVFPQQEEAPGFPQATAIPDESISPQQLPTPTTPAFNNLTIWVPPLFDLEADSEAAVVLKNHFQEFSKNNPQVILDVRVKSASGPGSIIETLANASEVAQAALPSLVLISRSDLVQAASKNLLFPIDGLSGVIDENDWFDISMELGSYQGTVYCLPFAINALGLVYRNISFNSDQPSWDEVIRQSEKLLFAAGDPEALTTLALYQSAGGVISDKTDQPVLESDALTTVLTSYATAARFQRISNTVLDYQNDDQVWDAFLSSNEGAVLTWASHALIDSKTMKLALLPSLGEGPYTLVGGWVWCLTEPHEQDRKTSIALAEHLVGSEFLALWAPVSGYLPVRPSTIPGFEGIELQNTITKMLLSGHVRPDKIQTAEIGTETKIALTEVIQKLNTPEASAINAVNRLEAIRAQ